VAARSAGILAFLLVVCAVIVWLGNLRSPREVADGAV
jgi:hypothetical protein